MPRRLSIRSRSRSTRRASEARRYRRELSTFALAALLTAPLVAQMVFMVTGRHEIELPVWLQFALATPVQFWAGARFYRGAWKALRGGAANMDVLVALGTTAAFVFSLAVWLVPISGQHVYFEASTVVITLVLLGKLLEGRAKAKTANAIRDLLKLQPATVLRERDGEVHEVPLAAVHVGDVFVVRAGDSIPVDGHVLTGESAVNEAMLTGESQPVAKAPGDPVLAGTVNETGPLRCEATAVGQATLLAGDRPAGRRGAGIESAGAAARRRRLRALRAGSARDRGGHARRERLLAWRLGRCADARDRRAGDRLSVRARARDADGADGRRRPRRAGGHPDQERRGAGARRKDRYAGRRQDRHADHGASRASPACIRPGGSRRASCCCSR